MKSSKNPVPSRLRYHGTEICKPDIAVYLLNRSPTRKEDDFEETKTCVVQETKHTTWRSRLFLTTLHPRSEFGIDTHQFQDHEHLHNLRLSTSMGALVEGTLVHIVPMQLDLAAASQRHLIVRINRSWQSCVTIME